MDMINLAAFVFANIIVQVVLYIVLSLVSWNFNPGEWHLITRIVWGMLTVFVLYRMIGKVQR